MKRLLILVALLPFLIAAAPATDNGTLALDQAAPKLGDTVTFSFIAPSGTRVCTNQQACLRIQLVCYQGGAPVYAQQELATDNFQLGGFSSQWLANGGAADCMAQLFEWQKSGKTQAFYASTAFVVLP